MFCECIYTIKIVGTHELLLRMWNYILDGLEIKKSVTGQQKLKHLELLKTRS